MTRVLLLVVAFVALAAALIVAAGRTVGVGPFAPGVPASWLYVLIARGGDEATAREVEAIDLATGERQLFALDGRVFEIALSSDRRTLFAASDRGVIFEIDATRGTPIGYLQLSASADVRRLAPLADGRRVVAVAEAGLDASVHVVDLGTGRERASLSLGRALVGTAIARDEALLLATSDRTGTDTISEIGLDPLAVRRQLQLAFIRRGAPQTAPPLLATARGERLFGFSSFSLRLAEFDQQGQTRREADLSTVVPRSIFGAGFDGAIAIAADGRVAHACVGAPGRGVRLRVVADERFAPERTADGCGQLLRLSETMIALAVRGKPELQLVDAASGVVRRTLALAGIPVRLAN